MYLSENDLTLYSHFSIFLSYNNQLPVYNLSEI